MAIAGQVARDEADRSLVGDGLGWAISLMGLIGRDSPRSRAVEQAAWMTRTAPPGSLATSRLLRLARAGHCPLLHRYEQNLNRHDARGRLESRKARFKGSG
jgi:hypothetical protein